MSADLKQISDKLDKFEQLSALERKDLLHSLNNYGKVTPQKFDEPDSVCPITKEEVRVSCDLKGCRYWVDHSWTKNCSINFMATQEKENLSVEQVSLLYRKAPERVDSIYKRSFKIVQRHYLRDIIRNNRVPQFRYIPGFCVTCQSKLLEEEITNPNLRLDEDFGYCSSDCKKKFPPPFFEVERFFQSDFFKVVELGSTLFNFYYLEEILGFQPNVLRNRLEKLRDSRGKD